MLEKFVMLNLRREVEDEHSINAGIVNRECHTTAILTVQ